MALVHIRLEKLHWKPRRQNALDTKATDSNKPVLKKVNELVEGIFQKVRQEKAAYKKMTEEL